MNKLFEFPVCLYGEIKKYNDVLSKCRCRIFYKYTNRNGTYISDNFAEQLIKSLPYVPIKGIYEGNDFTDHGNARSDGRIYGIVPENPNFAWEEHLDNDGVTRTYACADVLLFTALYSEANTIVDKAQSMELYEPSIKYHWEYIQGQRYVVFDAGCFLGLQALGNNVEPCFEGASFYDLHNSIENAIAAIKNFSMGGLKEMHCLNFKLSDNEKYRILWDLLNENYNEEHDWTIDYVVCDIYDSYALVYSKDGYERVYYEKNDENDSVSILSKKKCYVIDVTEEEKNTIDTLRHLNGDTYELVNEDLTNATKNANDVKEFALKIEELNNSIATLNTEAENSKQTINEIEGNYTNLQHTNESLKEENESLKNYKKNIELGQKEAIIAEYSGKLSAEILSTYQLNLDNYEVEELDMRLAYEFKKSDSSFNQQALYNARVLKNNLNRSGIEEILSRYKR